jgi:diguanylate cyclase (GGDEF)-like protein
MRVAAAAASANHLDDVLELTAEATLGTLRAASFSISRWERDREVMRTLINVGELGPGEERCPEDETYSLEDHASVGRLLRTAQPYFNAVDDPEADAAAVKLLRSLGKESDIGVPIVVDGEVWGEVWATTLPGAARFQARDVRFLKAVAAQLAGVIARAELFSHVSRMAYEDELTGLANRRDLDERLERAVERWKQESVPLTLLVCDVDELKTINDERGHHAGDRALRRVAKALVAGTATFPGATVARLSGDEFAVLLEGSPLSAASEVAGTVLKLLREDRDTALAVSCGAAGAGPGAERPDQLLRAADAAQYAAKQRGGGQLCTAGANARHESVSHRRRGRRRSTTEQLDETTANLLSMLDTTLANRTTVDRLEVVVGSFAETLNAAAWTISFSPHGSPTIRSVCSADDRDTRLRGIRVGLDDEVYALRDYPLTGRLVDAGGGSFLVGRHDRASDEAECALLAELDFSGVLATVAQDPDGTFLLELYADGDTRDLPLADLPLQLLARAAAARSSGALERMRQLEKRTRQLDITGSLGTRLSGLTDAGDIVEAGIEELFREFPFPLCAIARLNALDEFEPAAARGESAERLTDAGWRQPATVGLLGRAVRERRVVLVGDVRAEPDYRVTGETHDVRSELCCPIWAGDELWGMVDIEESRPDAFDADDARLVQAVADQLGAALRSARLYAQLERAYLDTAEALGSALEATDSYTASHSHSIAATAEAVGRALGMDHAELRNLRLEAAFHDIGKLAIPDSILSKQGPLDPDERARIEQHTVIGEQILAPIEFLAEIRPLVRAGHERWDGGGYPDGLAGDAIPLPARIVFACDAYDAMTNDRPYRSALSRDEAMAELRRHAGTQFDPTVVLALLEVLGGSSSAQPAVLAS